ncbi:hypothetical protein OSTOST_06176 [Ostertagia ostertagi]
MCRAQQAASERQFHVAICLIGKSPFGPSILAEYIGGNSFTHLKRRDRALDTFRNPTDWKHLFVRVTKMSYSRRSSLSNYSPLVKVVLPASSHWRAAQANARLLRGAGFPSVFIRKSLDFELRQLAQEPNKGRATNEWVVYKDQLTHISSLPSTN